METPSQALRCILHDGLRLQQEHNTSDTRTVLRRTFNRITGRREKCIMEVTHLLMPQPYVKCSHAFVIINIMGGTREVNTSGEDTEAATKNNLIDMYSYRLDRRQWSDKTYYDRNRDSLVEMSLVTFVTNFSVRMKKIHYKSSSGKSVVPVFSPDVTYSRHDHPSFWQY